MHLVDAVLFAHVIVAVVAFAVAGVLHVGQWYSRSAGTVAELRIWGRVAHRLEPLFPALAIVLFGLGAWLLSLSDGGFRWSDGWVITSAVGLGVMELVGGALLAPRSKKMSALLADAPDGPVDPAVRATACDPAVWALSHFATGTALGIVFLMTAKPSGAVSVAVVVLAAAVATAVGAAGARTAVRGRVAVAEPATA